MRYTILLQLVLTKQSVRLLEKYEINLNSPANGVFLPYQTNEFVTTEVMHMDLYNPKEAPVILLRDTYGETPHQYITKKQFERKRNINDTNYLYQIKKTDEELDFIGCPPEKRTEYFNLADSYFKQIFQKLKNKINDSNFTKEQKEEFIKDLFNIFGDSFGKKGE